MQTTGWGYTDPPVYNKHDYLLKKTDRSRYLKVAYVVDFSRRKDDPALLCKEDVNYIICAFNDTLVLNSDFNLFFSLSSRLFFLLLKPKKGGQN